MKKIAVVLLIFLIACGSGGEEQDTYFTGSTGVEMRMPDQTSPPETIHYYPDTGDNTFDISVEIWNKGSSAGRGGLYVSGYDPNMIHVEGINPQSQFNACGLSFTSLGDVFDGEFVASLGCGNGDEIVFDQGNVGIEADDFVDKLFNKLNL
ncbi:MAG: hypothetical protein ABEI52_09370, partial [Halobacteriaceae archaeon]